MKIDSPTKHARQIMALEAQADSLAQSGKYDQSHDIARISQNVFNFACKYHGAVVMHEALGLAKAGA